MSANWPTVRLGNYVDACLGKMLDKEKNRGELFPYLGNKNVRWGSFDIDDLAQMRFEDHEHERYGLKYGDLVVCEGGEPGRCAIWKGQIPGMKIQKALHRIRPKESLDNRFLHYWFLLSGRNGSLEPYFTGTTIKHLTGKAIAELEIPLPPLDEQKAIAHILGTLDDKIELNRQMNTSLEAMAQVLFKSWFVDFDPVIDNALAAGNPIPEPLQARAEVRKTLGEKRKSLPVATQKQFPSSFVFNEEMGWTPEGWQSRPVYDVANFINGAAFKGAHFSEGRVGLPIVKIAEIKNGITSQTKFSEQSFDEKYRIDDGEILFSWSGNPDTSIDTFVWSHGPGWLNQHIFKVSLISEHNRAFVYNLLKYLKPVFTEIARDKQTTGLGHVTAGDMKKLFVIQPAINALEAFEDQVAPMLGRRFNNLIANKQLSKSRDTLLPKLLSGQIRIPNAEQLVEAA